MCACSGSNGVERGRGEGGRDEKGGRGRGNEMWSSTYVVLVVAPC